MPFDHSLDRRRFVKGAVAAGSAAVATNTFLPSSVAAQDASTTLVIAAPATPQGLDIEFDVSLGSIDSLGALYEYMLAYEKIPIHRHPACCAKIQASIPRPRPASLSEVA